MSFSPSNITTGVFISLVLDASNGIAGSGDDNGIYYTSDCGATWTRSIDISGGSFLTGSFGSVALSGVNGIAGSEYSSSLNGIYYTTDSGATWTPSNVTTDFFT